MNALVSRFSKPSYEDDRNTENDEFGSSGADSAMWGSSAGFGNLSKGIPTFNLPSVPDVRCPWSFVSLMHSSILRYSQLPFYACTQMIMRIHHAVSRFNMVQPLWPFGFKVV
jgi:hypothetical protein